MAVKLYVHNKQNDDYYYIPEEDAISALTKSPDVYETVNDMPYLLRNKQTGKYEETLGINVPQMLGDGYEFSTFKQEAITQTAKEEVEKRSYFNEFLDMVEGAGKGFLFDYDPSRIRGKKLTAFETELQKEIDKSLPKTMGNIAGTIAGPGKFLKATRATKMLPKTVEVIAKGSAAYAAAKGVLTLQEGLTKKYVDEQNIETAEIMKNTFQASYKEAKETLVATSITSAALGTTGKILGLGGKGLKFLGRKVPPWFRESFFGVKDKPKDLKVLKKALDVPENTSADATLKEAENFMVKISNKIGDTSPMLTRLDMAKKLQISEKTFQGQLDNIRKTIKPLNLKEEEELLLIIKRHLRSVDKLAGKENLKTFKNSLENQKQIVESSGWLGVKNALKAKAKKIRQKVLEKNRIAKVMGRTPEPVPKITDITKNYLDEFQKANRKVKTVGTERISAILHNASEKSNFAKLEAKKGVQKRFRNFWKDVSRFEDKITKDNQFVSLKSDLHKTIKLKEQMEKAMSRFENLKFLEWRALLYGASPLAYGTVGFGLGGSVGAVAGLGIAKIHQQIMKSGYKYLQTARSIDNMRNFMGKVKSVTGINSLLNKKQALEDKHKIDFKRLMYIMTGRELGVDDNDIRDFPESDRYLHDGDLSSAVEDYGSTQNINDYYQASNQAKQIIASLLPRGFTDKYGKHHPPTKNEMDKYLTTINQGLSFPQFIKSVREKTLTQRGFEIAMQMFPDHVNRLNMNIRKGIQTGGLSTKTTDWYLQFLDSYNSLDRDIMWLAHDLDLKDKMPQPTGGMLNRAKVYDNYTGTDV